MHYRSSAVPKEPSHHIFASALQFYALAKPALDDDIKLQENVMAVVCNLALCIELLLKCSDSGVKAFPALAGELIGDAEIYSNVRGHNLEKIFSNLDADIANRLEVLFKSATGKDIKPLLAQCKDYFVHARYSYEPQSGHCYYVSEIQELAEGLITSIRNWYSA